MSYGRHGSMRTHPGKRDEVIAILLGEIEGLKSVGCQLYVVSEDRTDVDLVWVHEVWDDAVNHKASLQLPETRDAISRALPLLTGEFTGAETDVVGGLGISQ